MIVEQARLQIRHRADVCRLERIEQAARIRELVRIPREHVTLLAAARVSGPEVKARQWKLVAFGEGKKLANLRLRIRKISERHSGVGVTQAPARRHRCAAYQLHVTRECRGRVGARDHVVIKITVGYFRRAIEVVIVVELLPEIERAFGERVVIHTIGAAGVGASPQKERPVFVEWIAGFAVVAQRVELPRSKASPRFVQRAGFVTETEVLIVLIAGLPVVDLSASFFRRIAVARSVVAALKPLLPIELFPRKTKRL